MIDSTRYACIHPRTKKAPDHGPVAPPLTTTTHAMTDARGLPLELVVTPGQEGDCPVAARLLAICARTPSLLLTKPTTPTGCVDKSKPLVSGRHSTHGPSSLETLFQPRALPGT